MLQNSHIALKEMGILELYHNQLTLLEHLMN